MSTLPLAGAFAALLFVGFFGVSYATDQIADHVVINEVDTNPPGDDAKSVVEWVELYNPTEKSVNLSGWQISSSVGQKKTLTLPPSAIIKPGQFLVYSNQILWFSDISEQVVLKDKNGEIIDQTQVISDKKNDANSWQRKYDGLISDSNQWIFRMSSPGSSNGKLFGGPTNLTELTTSVTTDKKDYLLDETVTISGNVSKRVYQEKPSFSQQELTINVDGPAKFQQSFTMYPDANLKFKTKIKLDPVLGATLGTYKVDVKYGEATDSAIFTTIAQKTGIQEAESEELEIITDKEFYLPGQTVKFTAKTNTIIPGTGLKYSVYDPNGIELFSGKLFPDAQGMFSGNVFMSPTKPVYGTLDIVAQYGKQNARVLFELIKDEKDSQKIILTTDKDVYGPGENIIISGRSNKYVPALDLDVVQAGTGSLSVSSNKIFQLKDQVNLAGDSTFRYELKVPAGEQNLGDYKVTVSKDFGSATARFKIAQNPQTAALETNYYIKTDNDLYLKGQIVHVTGHVNLATRSSLEAVPVLISLMDENGKQIVIDTQISNQQLVQNKVITKTSTYSFTSIPDQIGNFNLDFKIPQSFSPASYTIRGVYDKRTFDTAFSVQSAIDIKNTNIIAKTDKSVYGLGQTVNVNGTFFSGQSTIKITLTQPGGKIINDGVKVDNSRFAWSWNIPSAEYTSADIRDLRQSKPTVFGVYVLTLSSSNQSVDLFFKVSKDPALDTLEVKPLEVNTDKSVYHAGEKLTVFGEAIKRMTADKQFSVVVDRVNVEVRNSANKAIYTSSLDIDNGGAFQATYDLPITIFKDGKYKIVATYQKLRTDTSFEIKNVLPIKTGSKLTLVLSADKPQYVRGDTVHITGSTTQVLSSPKLNLVVNFQKEGAIDCKLFYCGLGVKPIDISRSYSNGVFSYDYAIPTNAALGKYDVIVDTEFGTFNTSFDVVEQLAKKVTGPGKISDKFNRITNSTVEVGLYEQNRDGMQIAPNQIQGSLVVPKGLEKTTNLKITADDGSCIIGQSKECLVSESTKVKDVDYKIVKVAGMNYKVTYSGFDKVLEKFSITPEIVDDVIPDSTWTIKMDKPAISAKLYYEIVYKQIQ